MSRYARQLSAAARQYESESAYDEAEEAREEWIDAHADLIAADLMKDEDFVREAIADDTPAAQEAILQDVGRFFARFEAASDNVELARIGCDFYRQVKPYIEAAAKERALEDAAKIHDSMADAA